MVLGVRTARDATAQCGLSPPSHASPEDGAPRRISSNFFNEFLRRRPEIVAKIFSTLPSYFVEPYSEGT
eukprot:7130325-Prymnesium_polylepis.1